MNWTHLLATNITEVNLSASVYRLFHEDFSPIARTNLDGGSTICLSYIQQFGRVSELVVLMLSYPSGN